MPYQLTDMPAIVEERDRLAVENLCWKYDHDNQWSIFQSRAEDIADKIAFIEILDGDPDGSLKQLANWHNYEEIKRIIKAVITELEGMYGHVEES